MWSALNSTPLPQSFNGLQYWLLWLSELNV